MKKGITCLIGCVVLTAGVYAQESVFLCTKDAGGVITQGDSVTVAIANRWLENVGSVHRDIEFWLSQTGCSGVRYRVSWHDTRTGKAGHGDWSPDKETIKAWVEYGNKEYPEIIHALEVSQGAV